MKHSELGSYKFIHLEVAKCAVQAVLDKIDALDHISVLLGPEFDRHLNDERRKLEDVLAKYRDEMRSINARLFKAVRRDGL